MLSYKNFSWIFKTAQSGPPPGHPAGQPWQVSGGKWHAHSRPGDTSSPIIEVPEPQSEAARPQVAQTEVPKKRNTKQVHYIYTEGGYLKADADKLSRAFRQIAEGKEVDWRSVGRWVKGKPKFVTGSGGSQSSVHPKIMLFKPSQWGPEDYAQAADEIEGNKPRSMG